MKMLTQLVKVSLQNQCKRSFLARQTSLCNNLQNQLLQSNRKASSKNKTVDDENLDEPIKYSTSKAATWLAAETRCPMMDRHPQEKENDLDLLLEKPLSETIPGITMLNTPELNSYKTKF